VQEIQQKVSVLVAKLDSASRYLDGEQLNQLRLTLQDATEIADDLSRSF
jgi:hypothetical protein